MRSYKSLRIVATFFEVIACINLLAVAFFLSSISIEQIGTGALFLAASIIGFVILMAIAQLIRLFINSADNIQNINDNLYIIAKKVEESDKTWPDNISERNNIV